MKSLAVFCVFLAMVSWVELRTTAECDKLVDAYAKNITKDKTKDCQKFDEFKACYLEQKNVTLVTALDHLNKLELAVNKQNFSCDTRCANYTALLSCEKSFNPVGDRKTICLAVNQFVACIEKAGCSGNDLKEVAKILDFATRANAQLFCKPCGNETAMDGCRTLIAGIGKNKTAAGECPLYNKAKECFKNTAKCSSLVTKQEMDVADNKLVNATNKPFTCSTKCVDFQARNNCQKDGLAILFNTDDNTFNKDYICGTGEKVMRSCFTTKGNCNTTSEDEVAQMKGFRSDLGFCNSASSMAASVLTILMGAYLSSHH